VVNFLGVNALDGPMQNPSLRGSHHGSEEKGQEEGQGKEEEEKVGLVSSASTHGGAAPERMKLRGSPANVLGDVSRGKICRAFLFSAPRAQHDFCRRTFPHFSADRAHHTTRLTHQANNAQYTRSPQSMWVCTLSRNASKPDRATHRRAHCIITMMRKFFVVRCVERTCAASSHAQNFCAHR
jgi:hypothetical protein